MRRLEESLSLLQSTILPKFDDESIPGILGFSGILYQLNAKIKPLIHALQTKEAVFLKKILDYMPSMIADAKTLRQRTPSTLTQSLLQALELYNRTPGYLHEGESCPPDLQLLLDTVTEHITALDLESEPYREDQALLAYLQEHFVLTLSTPKHPLLYELLMILLEFLEREPMDLEALMPFFNPKAVPDILQTGPVGVILRAFGAKFELNHRAKDLEQPSAFVYQLTYPHPDADKTPITEIIDGEAEHRIYREWLLHAAIPPLIRRYLTTNSQHHQRLFPLLIPAVEQGNLRLQGELAREALWRSFTEKELATIEHTVSTYTAFQRQETPEGLTEAAHIDWLTSTISSTQGIVRDCENWQAVWHEKSIAYARGPFGLLIEPYEDLRHLKQQSIDRGLDTTYWHIPLPDSVTAVTTGPKAVRGPTILLKLRLDTLIKASSETLQRKQQEFTQYLAELAAAERALAETRPPLYPLKSLESTARSTCAEATQQRLSDTAQESSLHHRRLWVLQQQLDEFTANCQALQKSRETIAQNWEEKETRLAQLIAECAAIQTARLPLLEQEEQNNQTLFDLVTHSPHLDDYTLMLSILTEAKIQLESTPNPIRHMPFLALDGLMQRQTQRLETFDEPVFEQLLIAIDPDAPCTLWEKERARQENPLRRKASPEECQAVHDAILSSLKKSILDLTKTTST